MMRTPAFAILTAVFFSAGLFRGSVCAQISIGSLPGGSYIQDFDSLASSGTDTWIDNATLAGWYAAKSSGTPASFTNYTAGKGNGTTGALYSLGASESSERALGSLASGNANVGNIAYGVRFANDTGSDITSIVITYTGEQWRNSATLTAQTLSFSYLVSESPVTTPDPANTSSWTPFSALDFSTPTVGGATGALDGNDWTNRQVFSGILLTGVAVPAGSEIFLRWRDADDSGTDHAVAIDDLTVGFGGGTIATNPPTYAWIIPLAQTNKAGTTASLTVASDGYPSISLSYQWRKEGIPLSDTGNILGSSAPTLTITNLLAADTGSYDVIVANESGSATSAAATVEVIDPAIHAQSANQARLGGENVTFTVTAKGTPALTYQWYFEGTPISEATGSALVLPDLEATDQGTYTCWVTNALGASVVSTPIVLTVTVLPNVTLALWDFNDTNAPPESPPPAIGSGTALLLNNLTSSFVTGASADPGGTNRAWNTTGYPAQGTSNQTAGVQFNVSTLGYQNLLLRWYERHSSTGSKCTRVQYTTDGLTFTDLDLNTMPAADTFIPLSCDLSALPAVNHNPNFAFRIVSEFESSTNPNYVGTSGNYSSGGTIRFDLVSVYGDPHSGGNLASATISNLIGATLTYGGGSGSQFVLLQSGSAAAPLSTWTRVHTNFTTPGTFSVPAASDNAAFFVIKSE